MIRHFNPVHDTDGILTLHKRVFAHSKEQLPTKTDLASYHGFVCCDENTVSGYLLYSVETDSLSENKITYLDYIGVNPDCQTLGIGKLLIQAFCSSVLDISGLFCILHVENDTLHTQKLIDWYQRYGFTIYQNDIQSISDPGVQLTAMVRSISGAASESNIINTTIAKLVLALS